MKWKPIDWYRWDFSGKGKNLVGLLNDKEMKIWNAALEYQDTREGETGHGEVVTYFSIRLHQEVGGEREIIVPSAILHDIGWSQLSENERKLFYDKTTDTIDGRQIFERYEPILRARHQEQGKILAKKI